MHVKIKIRYIKITIWYITIVRYFLIVSSKYKVLYDDDQFNF